LLGSESTRRALRGEAAASRQGRPNARPTGRENQSGRWRSAYNICLITWRHMTRRVPVVQVLRIRCVVLTVRFGSALTSLKVPMRIPQTLCASVQPEKDLIHAGRCGCKEDDKRLALNVWSCVSRWGRRHESFVADLLFVNKTGCGALRAFGPPPGSWKGTFFVTAFFIGIPQKLRRTRSFRSHEF
ncbi:hypothetical protein GOODEAATRI_009873, partial [Goodea atripinnis]